MMLSFTNCQNDTVTEIQQEEATEKEFPFKTTLLTKQDIEANSKLSNQMRSLTNIQSSNIGKSIYNDTYGFTVDTDIVKFIEHTENNSHSYTFPIERENNTGNELENLVFTYDATLDDYAASLVTYHFSASQRQELLINGHISSSSYDMSYEPISVNIDDVMNKSSIALPCTTNFTVYHLTPDTNEIFLYSSTIGNVHNECQHEDANGDTTCTTYTTVSIDCPDGGSAGAQTGNTSDPTSGGGGNSNNENTSPDDTEEQPNIVTSPLTRNEVEELSIQLTTLFNGNDSWEFDSEINSLNGISYTNIEEIEEMLESESFESENAITYEDQNGLAHSVINVKINYWANLKIDIIQNLRNSSTNQEYEIDAIDTDYTGITFGSEWVPKDFNPNHHLSINGNLATIDVKGTLEFSIFFKRMGTVARDYKHYRFVINIDTGEIVSSEIID
ncbi:hypothetical protein [Kordia sp.]|uniref:hypothetical protein n=1 Tax=Kordia sp. TaxID=1965332 RepID=UPI003D6B23EA